MKYAITEGMTGRLRDLEECISDVEYRTMESTQTEQQTEKQIKKTNKQTNRRHLSLVWHGVGWGRQFNVHAFLVSSERVLLHCFGITVVHELLNQNQALSVYVEECKIHPRGVFDL